MAAHHFIVILGPVLHEIPACSDLLHPSSNPLKNQRISGLRVSLKYINQD